MRAVALLLILSGLQAQDVVVATIPSEGNDPLAFRIFAADPSAPPRCPVAILHAPSMDGARFDALATAAARKGRTVVVLPFAGRSACEAAFDRTRALAPCPGLRFHLWTASGVPAPEVIRRELGQAPHFLGSARLRDGGQGGGEDGVPFDDPSALEALLASVADPPPLAGKEAEVFAALDALHESASRADEDRYFALFAEDAVFLGTDATERWTLPEFRAFALPYFGRETAWVFVPHDRNVRLSPDGATAWFDERVFSSHYGDCRGTGVLVRTDKGYRVAQYNLTIPIPNDLAGLCVDATRTWERIGGVRENPVLVYLVRHAEKDTESGSDDPALTDAGRARADTLARVLGHAGVSTIFATRTTRTQATVAPLAALRNLKVDALAPSDTASVVKSIRDAKAGVFLVCGHSNTIPRIIAGLGGPKDLQIQDDEYDDLFLLSVDQAGRTTFQRLHYGPSAR